MNFLADECCDAGLVTDLRSDGHDVAYVLEGQTGISDDEVLQNAFVAGVAHPVPRTQVYFSRCRLG